ncbi:MAG: hypothetical protein J6K31_11100 [Parabacteroides sp.]|nr:hypothetical protein [Parabacteroides sp.]
MQSNKESFWQQAGIALMLLFYGIEWLLKNRTKWLIDQLPHRAKELKKQNQEIKALEEKLGLKKRNENAIWYDPYYYKHFTNGTYERYDDDSFFGPNSYLAKRKRYLEELREKVSKGWKTPEIIVSVESEYYPSPMRDGLFRTRYYVLVAVKINSVYDRGRKKRNLLKYYSASHLDECGNPMDYDVIWESKEIEDCKKREIATLKKRKEVVEFLEGLRKVDMVENIK